jgi:hypothetical protein
MSKQLGAVREEGAVTKSTSVEGAVIKGEKE